MTDRSPLLSVIIPTKNRYGTLVPVVEALISLIKDEDLEIVVQDNTEDNSDVANYFLRHRDGRLRYFHQPRPVSMNDNTVDAILNSRGRFVTFIGDDDTVAINIVEETRKLASSKMECLVHAPAYYWWSGVDFRRPDRYRQNNALWLPRTARHMSTDILSSKEELARVLSNGAVSYYRLPRLYHGVVSRRVLDEIYRRSGSYVPGASPDMALAVAIALVIDKYLYSSSPLTIFGASRNSGGGLTAQERHHGRLEEQKHLRKETLVGWSKELPWYWSEYTIYPQTVVEVARAFGVALPLDFIALYASIIVNERWLAKMTWPFVWRECGASVRKWTRFSWMLLRRAAGRTVRAVGSTIGTRAFDVIICPTISICMLELRSRAESRGQPSVRRA